MAKSIGKDYSLNSEPIKRAAWEQEFMEKINTILKDIRPESEFSGVTDFFARGMLDSFDLTLLVSALEQRYGIAIEGVDILPENFRSLDAIASLLIKYHVKP